MDKVEEITLSFGIEQMAAAVQAAGANKLARLARKFGAPRAKGCSPTSVEMELLKARVIELEQQVARCRA